MRFIGIRDFRNKSSKIWDELRKEREIVITSNGKPIALLSATTEENLEENLAAIRQAKAVAAVNAIQRKSVEMGTDKLSLEEINAEIKAVRGKRRK